MKNTLAFTLLMLMIGCAMAQTFQVRGVICDKSGREPLVYGWVFLTHESTDIFKAGCTNLDGTFEICDLPKGDYGIVVKGVGYRPHCTSVHIDSDLILDTIWMVSSFGTEVTSSDQWTDLSFPEMNKADLAELTKNKSYDRLRDYYYQWYHFLQTNPRFASADSPADSALKYLTLSWKQHKRKYAYLYYPIMQVEYSLGVAHNPRISRPKQVLPHGYLQPSWSAVMNDSCWANSRLNLLAPVERYLSEDSFYHEALSPMGIAPLGPGDGNAIVYVSHHPFTGYKLVAYIGGRLHVRNWSYYGTTRQSSHPLAPAQIDSIQALLKAIGPTPLADLVNRHGMYIDAPDCRVMTYIDGHQQWMSVLGCANEDDFDKDLQVLLAYLGRIKFDDEE